MKTLQNTTEIEYDNRSIAIDTFTINICNYIINYFDFINWHRICKGTWRYLTPYLYDKYLSKCLDLMMKRNIALSDTQKENLLLDNTETTQKIQFCYNSNVRIISAINIVIKIVRLINDEISHRYRSSQYNIFSRGFTIHTKFPSLNIKEEEPIRINKTCKYYLDAVNIAFHYYKTRCDMQICLRSKKDNTFLFYPYTSICLEDFDIYVNFLRYNNINKTGIQGIGKQRL